MSNDQQDFEQRLDDMLKTAEFGQPGTAEDDDELMQIAHLLASTDLSTRSRIEQPLRGHLARKAKSQFARKGNPMKSNLKNIAAAIMLAIVFTVAAPSLTALAQNLLAQVGLFNVTDRQETFPTAIPLDQLPEDIPTATPIPADARSQHQTEPITNADGAVYTLLSASQAATIAGFDRVREPDVLPDCYEFDGRIVFGGNNTTVDSLWHCKSGQGPGLAYVALSQTRGTLGTDIAAGPQAIASDVSIDDIPAVFIANADMHSTDGRLFNLLLWQEGDYSFFMSSPTLDEAEMLAAAESIYE